MTQKNYTIQSLLAEWGRGQHQTPTNNAELKNKILGSFSISAAQTSIAKKSLHAPWLSLILAGIAVFMLFVMPGKPKFGNYTPTTSFSGGGSGQSIMGPSYQAPIIDQSENPATDFTPPQQQTYVPPADNNSPAKSAPAPSYNAAPAAAMPSPQPGLQMPSGTGAKKIELPPYIGSSDKLYNPLPETLPYQPQSNVPITDNRELLKTDYSASVLTRSVADLSGRLQTTVRGFGGRVDSNSVGEKFGYISFVVPADKFGVFSQEIKSLVGERFYKENVQTENLLPQKKSIEADQNTIGNSLDQLYTQKDQLTKNHNKIAGSIRSQINSYSAQLEVLKNQRPDNLQQYLNFEAQKEALANAIKTLQARLAQENNTYSKNITALDSYIQDAQNNLVRVNQQNTDLLDAVATVRGTITLNWISIWEMINLYIPLYWISLVLIIGAIATYFFRRRAVILVP